MLKKLSRSSLYWMLLIVVALSMEVVALYYQYRLDYWPCVSCIHIRLWLVLLMLVAFPMLLLHRYRMTAIVGHGLAALVGAGMTYTSWHLLGVERGFITGGTCDMDLGLPSWLAVEQWAPWLFEVQTPCGYTPELLFGITMAEALLAFSILLVVVSVLFSFLSFKSTVDND